MVEYRGHPERGTRMVLPLVRHQRIVLRNPDFRKVKGPPEISSGPRSSFKSDENVEMRSFATFALIVLYDVDFFTATEHMATGEAVSQIGAHEP